MLLETTLAAAAAAALINIWLGLRISALRRAHSVSVGDGGNEALARRMRAQLNFAENTPIVLLLIAALEICQIGEWWLPIAAAVFVIARIAHGFGMDGGRLHRGRSVGTLLTLAVQLWLAGVAVGAALRAL